MHPEPPLTFVQENHIGILQFNRPRARNALNWEAQALFAKTIAHLEREPDRLAGLLIIGTGAQAFASGGDLKELQADHAPQAGQRLRAEMGPALSQLEALPFPVLGVANGDVAGGGWEILAACDLRLSTPHARFYFAQIRMGLTTGWGGARRLVQLVGKGRALEWLLSGRTLSAAEATELGFIQRLLPAREDPLQAGLAWLQELAQLPQDGLRAMKELVHAVGGLDAAEAEQLEERLFLKLFGGANHREALASFAEKRPPRFNQ